MVEQVKKGQKTTKRMLPIIMAGGKDSLRTTCFINQPDIKALSEEEKRKYTLATLLWNREANRVKIDLYFNSTGELENVTGIEYNESNIGKDEEGELQELGAMNAKSRIENYRKQNHKKKIGRNDLCPCGSGKKYKYCCGR